MSKSNPSKGHFNSLYNLIVPFNGKLYLFIYSFLFYSYVILHSAQYNRGGEFFTYFINRLQIPQRESGLPESTNKENSLSNKLSIPYNETPFHIKIQQYVL